MKASEFHVTHEIVLVMQQPKFKYIGLKFTWNTAVVFCELSSTMVMTLTTTTQTYESIKSRKKINNLNAFKNMFVWKRVANFLENGRFGQVAEHSLLINH